MGSEGLRPGQQVDLTIEKPAAGGRMIGRHEGQVVLVAGAVPGEQVRVRVERADKRLAFATVVEIKRVSPDRRAGLGDPTCGGCVYSHIAYSRQLALKSDIVRDAFARIGRVPIDQPVPVAASPETGYRMRARLHVERGRVGFFREGTHTLCDPSPTGQLSEAALASIRTAVDHVERSGARAASVELTENVPATERALAITVDDAAKVGRATLSRVAEAAALAGCIVVDLHGAHVATGELSVGDPVSVLSLGRGNGADLRRHPESFFQANRYLVPALVAAVIDAVLPDGGVLDLYAGVGLFAVSLAASGRSGIVAVEGDRASGADLQRNAGSFGAALTLSLDSVESFLATPGTHGRPATVIVDPPRTGMSPAAVRSLVDLGAGRVIYVSCDPATLARDARQLLDSGYALAKIEAFDLFPNTPHVESVAVFDR
jgi:23S rRNA (uracil1939-C5)-methyltransferase